MLSPSVKRLSVLIAIATVDMMGLMMVAPLMPFYALRFNAPEWMVGPLISAFAMAQLVSSPIWGRVSDRHGRRPALLIGLAGGGAAFVIFGIADSIALLFLSRIVQGLGGGTTGVAQAYVADTMPPAERAKALGWLSAGTSAGVVVGPFLGSMAARLGPAAPGLLAAAVMFVNLFAAWYWLPESKGARPSRATGAAPPPPRPVWHAVWVIVRHPSRPAHRVIWIYCVGMLALNALIGVLALYLKDTFRVTEQTIGYFFPVFGIVGVLMRATLVGYVNDRLGEVRTMRLGATLLALGLALMPLPQWLPLFVVFLILTPMGTALLFPASTALLSHRADKHELGLVLGAQQTLRGIMSIAGPIGATVAYASLGHGVPFFLAAATVAVAGLLAAREPHERAEPATMRA
jgi:MFS family permease